jgi:hypothetical protein
MSQNDQRAQIIKMNKLRADRAAAALKAYLVKTYTFEKTDFAPEDMTDLVCDIMHLAYRMGFDAEEIVKAGRMHFRNELEPDDLEMDNLEKEDLIGDAN